MVPEAHAGRGVPQWLLLIVIGALVAALVGQWWWQGEIPDTAMRAAADPAPGSVPVMEGSETRSGQNEPEPSVAEAAGADPGATENTESQAELLNLRQQAIEQRGKISDLEIRLRDTEVQLAEAAREVELLRARPTAEVPEPAQFELKQGGVDPLTFEIEKDGDQVRYRVGIARAVAPTAPIDDAPVRLSLVEAPTVRGNIRMVIVPLGNRNERIYEPVEAWKRENGWPIEVGKGLQVIEGNFDLPDSGIDEVRLEVLRYGPGNGYTLIRRVTRWPEG
ncbi:MAG: hypothetical protein ACPGU7_08050 [Gammaproteobacteria bacterium]